MLGNRMFSFGPRMMSRISTSNEAPKEAPYVHVGDKFISQGRSFISNEREEPSSETEKRRRAPATSRNISSNYIFDRNVARKISQFILPLHKRDHLFIEINPGIGCLTAELLSNGLKSLQLIEANQNFLDYLKNYKQFSDTVSVCNQRFSYFGDAVTMSSLWVNMLQDNWSWDNEPQASVFSVIPPRQERFLIPWLVNMISSWHSYGRFKYFFVISDRLLWRCTNSEIATSGNFKHYTVGHILAATLLDIKLLVKMPKSEFVPTIPLSHVEQNAKTKKDNAKFEAGQMALTVIEPRRELLGELDLADTALYAAFVRQLTARRHARLIPVVERLMPGMGLALLDIDEVSSPSVRIGDLSPKCFLEIFRLLKQNSHFVPELFLPNQGDHHHIHHHDVETTPNKSKCDRINNCHDDLVTGESSEDFYAVHNNSSFQEQYDDEYSFGALL